MSMQVVYGRNVDHEIFKHNLTPAKLAETLGVSPETLRRVRQGHGQTINADLLTAMCQYFDLTPNDFLLPREGISYTNAEKD